MKHIKKTVFGFVLAGAVTFGLAQTSGCGSDGCGFDVTPLLTEGTGIEEEEIDTLWECNLSVEGEDTMNAGYVILMEDGTGAFYIGPPVPFDWAKSEDTCGSIDFDIDPDALPGYSFEVTSFSFDEESGLDIDLDITEEETDETSTFTLECEDIIDIEDAG